MNRRRLFNIALTFVMLFGMVSSMGISRPQPVQAALPLQNAADKIEPDLQAKFAAEGSTDFIVRFTNQADLTPAYSMDWAARGEFVVNALTEATKDQDAAKAYLDGQGLKYETRIAANDLFVFQGVQSDAMSLAGLPEVASIRATRTYQIDPATSSLISYDVLQPIPESLDWGLIDAKADQFWTAFGLQGDGIVVANIDTGVQYNHPALDQAFHCATPSDPACWSDPENWCGGSACDNNGHGTHTMGTMVGDDDPSLTYQVGMAPNAQWIACKGCGTSSCSDFALTSCADWILQPGGDPANRPMVVNNSWGGGGNDPWYQSYVQAWVADGIFPAFSAGNSTGCSSLGSPGDYQESFGTTGHTSTRAHAFAQGPSAAFGHDPYTKPNISGPAVNICSSVPTNGWNCSYSGTSMASPHSAGAVALLMSCNPGLIGQVDTLFQTLQNNTDAPDPANPACGVPPDGEGTYEDGYGYLNVLAAGIAVCGDVDFGHIEGHVYEADGFTPIEGASVDASPAIEGAGIDAITDPNGYYTMTVVAGTYNVTASKAGFASQTVSNVVVNPNETATVDFSLDNLGGWQIGPNMCFDLTRIDAEFYPANGLVYILGGRGGADGSVTDPNIYSFDPATGECLDTGEDMPFPISNYTINLVNNGTDDVLCTFGGRGSTGTSILNVQCYNPLTNVATSVGDLPAAYTGYTPGGQVVVDNMVYVFGGFNNAAAPYELARTDRYDPVANSFTQIGDLTQARAYLQATVVDGKIYAFGGTVFDGTNLNAQTTAEVMADPGGAGTWDDAAVADLPTAGAEGRAFGFDTGSPFGMENQIVIAGGGQWPAETAEVFLYDIASDTYDYSFMDLAISRRDHAGVLVPLSTPDPADGLPGMWVFGGRSSAPGYGGDLPPYAPAEFYPLTAAAAAPDITVNPTALSAEVCADSTLTQPLQICNIGDAPLNWNISEAEAGPAQVPNVPTGDQSRLNGKAPAHIQTRLFVQPEEDIIGDGGFEAGTPNPFWAEYSTNFGSPLCTLDFCNPVGSGPHGGSWWTWFGGIDAVYEEGYVAQDVLIPTGDAFLSFWMEAPTCADPNSYMKLLVDGTELFAIYGDDPLCNLVGYVQQTIDLGAYADGGTHTIEFYSETFGVGVDNFFVDDVVLDSTPGVDIPWLSEDPTAGTVQAGECFTVSVTYNTAGLTPGLYTAALNVNSNDPDTPVVNVPVDLTVPEPAAIADVTFTTDILEVTFTSSITGSEPLTYAWDFGDGTTSDVPNPVHTYAEGGCYDVSLTVSNACAVDTWTAQVCVCEPLEGVDFGWTPVAPVTGDEVTFEATWMTGTMPFEFVWNFGDGTFGTGITATHTYTATGDYTVTLEVENACDAETVVKVITVAAPCDPLEGVDFFTVPAIPRVDEEIAFEGTWVTGTEPVEFLWDFGDGLGITNTHVFTAEGSYTVTMVAMNACSEVVFEKQITILPPCETPAGVDFTWTPDPVFAGDNVSFAATWMTGTLPFTFDWNFGDGSTGTGQDVDHVFEAAGTYTVTLTVTNECGSVTVFATVDVSPAMPPFFKAYLPVILKATVP